MFWDNLSALCKDHGISISRLCAELGLSNSIATKWKKGSIPNNGTLKKIANYFNVSVDCLVASETIDPSLTKQERFLLNSFRSLSNQGQEYILQTMDLAVRTYKKDNSVSDMEKLDRIRETLDFEKKMLGL